MYTPVYRRMIGYTSSASVSHSTDTDTPPITPPIVDPTTPHTDPIPNEDNAPATCKDKAYNMLCDCLDSIADACAVM